MTRERLPKSHPSVWQKVKAFIAKIDNADNWAITRNLMLIPGAELARQESRELGQRKQGHQQVTIRILSTTGKTECDS